jgi:hypothetical protein
MDMPAIPHITAYKTGQQVGNAPSPFIFPTLVFPSPF